MAAVQSAAFEFCSPFRHAAFGIATKVLGRPKITQPGVQAALVVVVDPGGNDVLGCQIVWWPLVAQGRTGAAVVTLNDAVGLWLRNSLAPTGSIRPRSS